MILQIYPFFYFVLLLLYLSFILDSVVATTRRNGTHSLLTSAKLSVGYLVVGIKFTNGGLSLFLFYISFLFSFCFIFLFSIFRTTRVRADRSRCHISHNLMA